MFQAAHDAWSHLNSDEIDGVMKAWNHGLNDWRSAMEAHARQTGETPRGRLQVAGSEGFPRGYEETQRDRDYERRREPEPEDQLIDERRVGSSGFTSING